MENNNKRTALIFVIVVLLGIGGWFIYKTVSQPAEIGNKNIQQVTENDINKSEPILTELDSGKAESIDVSSWSIFTNTEHGFNVKYPPEWLPLAWESILEDNELALLHPDVYADMLEMGNEELIHVPADIIIRPYPNTENLSLEEFANSFQNGSFLERYRFHKDRSISDRNAIQGTSDTSSEVDSITILINNKQNIIYVYLRNIYNREIFEGVLESLQFVD